MKRILDFLDSLERVLLAVASRIGPWLAPLGPAYAIARATEHKLSWPTIIVWAVGISVEAVGIAASNALLTAYSWNRRRNKSDPSAPTWLAIIMVAAYLVIGIILAVLVEVFPELVVWSPASLFVLAGVGYAVIAMNVDQTQREVESRQKHDNERESRRVAKLARQERHETTPATSSMDYDAFVSLMATGNGDRPTTPVELSRQHGVNLRTAQRWFKRRNCDRMELGFPKES